MINIEQTCIEQEEDKVLLWKPTNKKWQCKQLDVLGLLLIRYQKGLEGRIMR